MSAAIRAGHVRGQLRSSETIRSTWQRFELRLRCRLTIQTHPSSSVQPQALLRPPSAVQPDLPFALISWPSACRSQRPSVNDTLGSHESARPREPNTRAPDGTLFLPSRTLV